MLDVAVPVDVAVAEGTARKALVSAPRQYRFGRCPHAGIDASTVNGGLAEAPQRPSPIPRTNRELRQPTSGEDRGNEEPVSDIRRITVLPCNALGDYLMTTPAPRH